MENKKFEQLIDLIINEDEEQAKELFHDIVVAKSKEIYESIMEDEMMDDDDMHEGMGGQVGDLADEIQAEESGIAEDEDEIDMDSEEVFDIEGDDEVDATLDIDANSSDEVEDAVIRIEDKLDQLMDEFEEIMGKEDDLMGRDDEMDADMHDIEDEIQDQEVDVDVNVDDEELVAEAITLQKITAKMGDAGENSKSPVDANSGQKGMDAHPVDFDLGNNGEQGRPAPTAKDVDGASSFQNIPGRNAKKLSAAPKPVTAQASGTNTKSVID